MENKMKSRALIIGTILSLVIAIMIPGVAAAKGGKPPQDDPPEAAGLLYGDLYVVERDGAGVPLLKEVEYTYFDYETNAWVTDSKECLQPLAYDCSLLYLWGECEEGEEPCNEAFDPEAHDACEVWEGDADRVQEVSFGRGSVTRSQPFVIDSAYGEFLKVINDAIDLRLDPAGRVQMYIPDETDPEIFFWKTVDAPLENLGMYRAAMSFGCFHWVQQEKTGEEGATIIQTSALDPSAILALEAIGLGHLVCDYIYEPDPSGDEWAKEVCWATPPEPLPDDYEPERIPCWWEDPFNFDIPDRTLADYEPGDGVEMQDMESATAFLAAATDKGDAMSLDEAMTINTYIGINTWILEGSKKDQYLTIKYFPFATDLDGWFQYSKATTFPTDTTADLLFYYPAGSINNSDGIYAENPDLPLFDVVNPDYPLARVALDEVNLKVCREGLDVGYSCTDSSSDPQYDPEANDGCGGANWFAQAAEHRRLTVWYLHNWSVPELEDVP
jgi:hypothetical protein